MVALAAGADEGIGWIEWDGAGGWICRKLALLASFAG